MYANPDDTIVKGHNASALVLLIVDTDIVSIGVIQESGRYV
jgi:hypothetical protein